MTVMLLGGLWHGALWNFVIWGGIHGVMLAVERRFEKDSLYRRLPGPVKMAVTFLIVTIAWVFFRAPTLGQAGRPNLGAMFGLGTQTAGGPMIAGLIYQPYYLLVMLIAAGVVWLAPQTWNFTRELTWAKAAWCAAAFAMALAVMMGQAIQSVHLLHLLTMASLSIRARTPSPGRVGRHVVLARGVKGFLFGFFVAIVGGGTAWHVAAELVDTPAWPRALDPTRLLPGWEELGVVASEAGWPSAFKAANDRIAVNIADYRGRPGGSLAGDRSAGADGETP